MRHDTVIAIIIFFQVAIHGYLTFGRPEACCPSPSLPSSSSNYVVAPFETSALVGDGSVAFEVHDINSHSNFLGRVNKFIRQAEQNTFAGTWMLVVEWKNVSQPGDLMGNLV